MHDLLKIAEECISELKAIYIPIQDNKIKEIVAVPLDKDGYVGHCIVTEDGGFSIGIWEKLLIDSIELTTLKGLICHELLHTCDGCMNHRGKFRRHSRKIDKYYNYGLMTSDDDYLHPEKPVLEKLQCPKCKLICKYRNEETCAGIRKMKSISENLLPRCPYCRTVMMLLPNEWKSAKPSGTNSLHHPYMHRISFTFRKPRHEWWKLIDGIMAQEAYWTHRWSFSTTV